MCTGTQQSLSLHHARDIMGSSNGVFDHYWMCSEHLLGHDLYRRTQHAGSSYFTNGEITSACIPRYALPSCQYKFQRKGFLTLSASQADEASNLIPRLRDVRDQAQLALMTGTFSV